MPAAHSGWTVEMLDALPDDGQRYEIIDGALLVTPAPSNVHQLVAGAFYRRLDPYLRTARVGRALFAPADVRTGDRRRNRVQPDVFAVRLVDGRHPEYPYQLSDLLLAIEVESASSQLIDHEVKRDLYLSSGVPEYWIANVDARSITRWRAPSDPGTVCRALIAWQPNGMDASLVIDLPTLFAEALS